MKTPPVTGLLIAIFLVGTWLISLLLLLNWQFSWQNPLIYFAVLMQMHLYTGLFITAHDAMHGTISASKRVNTFAGQVCSILYALFPYRKLYDNHHRHHRHVHSADDPDYHHGNFFSWYFHFMKGYLSWWQIVGMAILFNVLKTWFPEKNLLLFWIAPSLLSTLQLFYFGTWLPHHGQHTNPHQSRTLQKNHLLAFLSCYFFGYHYEHHDAPGIPWWKLWRMKG